MDPYSGERRGDLLRLNLSPLRDHIRAVLAAFPDVAGAYLFGSALDFVRSRSDIDVGLILTAGLPWSEAELLTGRIEQRLGRYGPHPFQVVALRPEQNSFTFRVLRDGELVYVANEERVTDVIEAVGRQHDDLAPFRRTFFRALGMEDQPWT